MKSIITLTVKLLPLLFAIGFLAPLFHQSMVRLDVTLPYGLPPFWVGLGVALIWGTVAQIKGRWL